MGCFTHKKVIQRATLTDNANNVLKFQTAELCSKCGKIFTQELKHWNFETGEFDEK